MTILVQNCNDNKKKKNTIILREKKKTGARKDFYRI